MKTDAERIDFIQEFYLPSTWRNEPKEVSWLCEYARETSRKLAHLAKMVRDAEEAMRSENMHCAWCGERIWHNGGEHRADCDFLLLPFGGKK